MAAPARAPDEGVRVIYEGVATGGLTPEVARGIARVNEQVPRPDEVEIVIAGDFVKAVTTRLSGPETEYEYTTDRLFGAAAAKSLLVEGRSVIVMDARHLLPGALTTASVERLFSHEGYHVAIEQRGETLSDLRLRHGLRGMSSEGTFAAFGGTAAEEYRVERALCDDGLPIDAGHLADLPLSLQLLRAEIIDGITNRTPNEPIDRCCQTVLTAFHRFTLLCAYLAGDELAGGAGVGAVRQTQNWSRLVSDYYDDSFEILAKLPSAATATPRADLDQVAFELGELYKRWLQYIGFTVENQGDGIYFDVLSHDF
jgi:hypothetical protein